jgi:tRNA nucleotidyltransferase (CCA-adding enzyme)
MDLGEVLEEVKRRVTPTEEERAKLLGLAEHLKARITEVSSRYGVHVEPVVVGSLAKDTWLRGEGDLDIFMLFPKEYGRRSLEDIGLRIAAEVSGGRGVKAYAEHPYLRFYVDGVKVDLVPALKVDQASAKATAVDRTPFHLAYVNSKLDDQMRTHVRLLKRFMKGIGSYGAEARTLGFSGYVCELLTIKYGSFDETLRAAANWRPPTTILVEGGGHGRFEHHIVVVDPTDPSRNAAAAVSIESYANFVAACQRFLTEPHIRFFYPPPPKPVDPSTVGYGSRGRHLVMVVLDAPNVVEEVLWSELRSSTNGVLRQLERHGFNPTSSWFWCDGQEAYMWFEVDRVELPHYEKRVGPPVHERQDAQRFLEKNSARALRGPWIEHDRWVVETERSTKTVVEALRRHREIDLSPHIRAKYASATILVDGDAVARIAASKARETGGRGLIEEFSRFYHRSPAWLT